MASLAAAGRELRASYAFVERNINLVKRYWGWELVWIAYTVANSLAVVLIASSVNAAVGSESLSASEIDRLVLFLAIGTVVWHYLAVVFEVVSDMISWERWEGTIEYTFMAPVRRATHMVGTTLFSLVYGLVHTVLIMIVIIAVFDLDMSGADYGAATLVLVVGSLSFVGIGIASASLPLLYPERGAQMTHVIQATLLLVSGVYAVPEAMPEPLASLAKFSPATYVLEGIRSALMDGASTADVMPIVIGLLVVGAASVPVGVALFSRAERYAKVHGKLKRSG